MASLNPLQGQLGHYRAAHLLRRASFRYKKEKIDTLSTMTADQAVDLLLQPHTLVMEQPVYDGNTSNGPVNNYTWLLPPGQPPLQEPQDFLLRRFVMGWWVNEAVFDQGITHRMAMFFHQHMVVTANSLQNGHFFDYLNLLRWGALGNFKKLATKLVTDNCMLRYLNNNENTAANPNENFAREFFELFTIGKGPQIGPGDYTNYTEEDIIQAARVFTGFRTGFNRQNIDPETGIPRGVVNILAHDTQPKTFSAKFQSTTIQGGANAAAVLQELDNFVNMVFDQEEVSKNFCRRLYRWFVSRHITPEIETDIIEPLAQTFRNNNYEIKPVLKQLLQSEHFYDEDDSDNTDEIIGALIRSPLELLLHSLTFFDLDDQIPDPYEQNQQHYNQFYSQSVLNHVLGLSGMPLFFPSDVAGYPGYYQAPDYNRQFFNSSTIIARYKLPSMLLSGRRQIGNTPNAFLGIKLDIAPWVRDSGFFSDPSDPYLLVQELVRYMLPAEATTSRFNHYYQTVFLDNLPPADWTYEWQNYLNTGNAQEVTIALERLVNAVMYSQEYQLF